jgi:hypothetical protein
VRALRSGHCIRAQAIDHDENNHRCVTSGRLHKGVAIREDLSYLLRLALGIGKII